MSRLWRDRVTLTIELGVRGTAVGGMVWDVSRWDEADWSGLEPEWVAVTGCEVVGFQATRGRKRGFGRHATGTAEVIAAWDAPGGRWSLRPTSPVQLGQELRVRAVVPEASPEPVPLFRGMVRSIRDTWNRNGQFRLTIRMTDRFAELGAVDLPEQDTAAGLGDLTHQRILRILALAEIPDARAEMGTWIHDSGVVEHQSSTFARNLLEEAWTSVESEGGSDLVVNRDGLFRFRRAQWWKPAGAEVHPRWNVTQATWTNIDAAADDPATFAPVSPGGFDSGRDLDDVVNRVAYARTGGTAQVAENADSVIRYGLRTYQRFDLTNRYDPDVLADAELMVLELGTRTDRVDTLRAELDPSDEASDVLAFVDVDIGDQHRVRWRDDTGTLEGTFHVQGIRLRVTPERWSQDVDLWAYDGFGLEPAPEAALWGSAVWGTSLWG